MNLITLNTILYSNDNKWKAECYNSLEPRISLNNLGVSSSY